MTEGKGTALVTGASMGIGAVYADRLARRGYDLVLVARDRVRLEALATTLRADTGRKVEVLAADLVDGAGLSAVEARLRDDGSITALVNNAGIAVLGPTATADADKVQAMLDLNVTALTRLTLAALPGFIARGEGAVINIASIVPLIVERFPGLYGSTKAFVIHFSQSLQAELEGTGVRIQAVLPGATATDLWDKSGRPLASLPPEIVMPTGAMVDAALSGLDQGEAVTIPALPDPGQWQALTTARLALAPNLSLKDPAPRYAVKLGEAA